MHLAAAVPTFLAVSIMPGLCMTLAMTMGMAIGVKRTLWMMAGELAGVALVATLAAIGIAVVIVSYPSVYRGAKFLGGLYLGYLAIRLLLSRPRFETNDRSPDRGMSPPRSLALRGFVAAVSNPKAWILYASILPPFIDPSRPFAPQLFLLTAMMLAIEFACLLIYASGGYILKSLLQTAGWVRAVNLLAGAVIFYIGGDLIFSA